MSWTAITVLGESSVALPLLMGAAAGAGVAARSWRVGLACVWPTATAALASVLSKIAFMGFGCGMAGLDFTGASGHALLAAAVYPLLVSIAWDSQPSRLRWAATFAAMMLAALVAASRVAIGVHSASESMVGFAIGLAAAGTSIHRLTGSNIRLSARPVAGVTGLLLCVGALAPPAWADRWIAGWAAALSGREAIFQRGDARLCLLQGGDPAEVTMGRSRSFTAMTPTAATLGLPRFVRAGAKQSEESSP